MFAARCDFKYQQSPLWWYLPVWGISSSKILIVSAIYGRQRRNSYVIVLHMYIVCLFSRAPWKLIALGASFTWALFPWYQDPSRRMLKDTPFLDICIISTWEEATIHKCSHLQWLCSKSYAETRGITLTDYAGTLVHVDMFNMIISLKDHAIVWCQDGIKHHVYHLLGLSSSTIDNDKTVMW